MVNFLKPPIEIIALDQGSSFKVLHHKVMSDSFLWNYHCHPEFELVYVRDGIGRRHVGNHLSYYQDGDLVLIGSYLPHSGFGYGAEGLHEEVVVQFILGSILEESIHLPEMSTIRDLFKRAQFGLCFYGQVKHEVGELMLQVKEAPPSIRFLKMIEVFIKLSETDSYVMLNNSTNIFGVSDRDQSRLKKIYVHLEKKYSENIDINEVADLVHLSVPAFCNYFKKLVNKTYTDFVNEFRINKACQMLVSDKSILDIGFDCGFASQSYFSKVFKKVKGLTPMEFRNGLMSKTKYPANSTP